MADRPTSAQLAERCRTDGEFAMASRYWSGGIRFEIGGAAIGIQLVDGAVHERTEPPAADDPGVITLAGDDELWARMLAAVPERFFNDVAPARRRGLDVRADELLHWQYGPAVQRAVELLRRPDQERPAEAPASTGRPTDLVDTGPLPRFDHAVGRYVHVELGGADHRVYFEEAGQGIPMLLQHTAGSHGVQWRHLLECSAITEHFRLIAYDLPFHGKSVPPTAREWWAEPYRLDGEFLRSVPLALADALALDRPAFMGCSVGGLLALDLAARHPDRFRAVISLEGALRVGGDLDALKGFWHPAVSNETKARMMAGLTAPTSPLPYVKETTQTYASGWPPAFLGDLWYYCVDYDLRELAATIDTAQVGVHIMTGEYDYSATLEHGRDAHDAIAGSTFTPMRGLGHFPMSENPARFIEHLLPVLDRVRGARAPAG